MSYLSARQTGTWLLLCLLMLAAQAGANPFETLLMPGKLSQAHKDIESDCDACHTKFRKKGQPQRCTACHDHADVARDIREHRGFHGRLAKNMVGQCDLCHSEHKGREADIVGLNRATFDHAKTDFALHGAHREVACEACHPRGKKFREAKSSCYACHRKDDAHGGKLGKQCEDCHKSTAWKKTGFDHDKTHFALEGKHRKVACALCHPDNRYKGVPRKCVACHGGDDVHNGNYGRKCAECHSPKKWQQVTFDHDRKTKFPLRHAHKRAPCRACHGNDVKKKKLKRTCVACHAKDDLHKGRNGRKCESCHNDERWSNSTFDHAKTRFRLTGRHRKLVCVACHKGNPSDERNRRKCNACHAADDIHKGHAGPACDDCHGTAEWRRVKFDHDRDTDFVLRGKHKKQACGACHTAPPKQQSLATGCYDCHRADDVHEGQQGHRCERCHGEQGWIEQVRFDHDLSAFPLIGQHALVSCEACHLSTNYKDVKKICGECHEKDDVHKGGLGNKCGECHNPNAWSAWIFDHDTQTDFRLEGRHRELRCQDCHTGGVGSGRKSKACVSCHRADDVHHGAFGMHCDQCHDQKTFSRPVIRR